MMALLRLYGFVMPGCYASGFPSQPRLPRSIKTAGACPLVGKHIMLKRLSLAAALVGMALPVVAAEALSREAPVPASCAVPAVPLDLATVVRLALCRHPDTRTAWLNAEAQAARVDSARVPYRPTLDASLGQTRNVGDNVSPDNEDRTTAALSLGWLLYDFGARAAGKAQAERTLDALRASQDDALQSVLQRAVEAYYQWLAVDASLLAARDSETAAAETLRAAGVRQRVGVATREDVLQSQTSLSQARLAVLTREGEQQVARGRMAIMLGLPASTSLTLAETQAIPESPALPPLASFLTAVDQRPDVMAQGERVKASEAALAQARASHRPDIRLSADQAWTQNNSNDSDTGSIGVRLNVPLYTGGQRAADVRLAEAQLALTRTELERLQQDASQEIWEAWQTLKTATAAFSATRDLVGAAEESHRAATARYKAGLGDLINVLNAQSSLADARQQFVKARYEWARARISLARATGTLGFSSLDHSAQVNATGDTSGTMPAPEMAP